MNKILDDCDCNQCGTERKIEKPDFKGMIWNWLTTPNVEITAILEDVWNKGAEQYKIRLEDITNNRDYWMGAYEDEHHACTLKAGQVESLETSLHEMTENRDFWLDRCYKLKEEVDALGKNFRYKQDLNEDLAEKLDAAYKREAELRKRVDQIEYVQESIDALERMINLLKYKPGARNINAYNPQ